MNRYMEHTEEMTFGEADKIIKEFGITCRASEVFSNARVIITHNEVNRDLLAACLYTLNNLDAAERERLITAPRHFQAQLGESVKMLRAAVEKAGVQP